METIAIIAVAFVCAIVVVGLVTAIVALRDAVKAKHAREAMETAPKSLRRRKRSQPPWRKVSPKRT